MYNLPQEIEVWYIIPVKCPDELGSFKKLVSEEVMETAIFDFNRIYCILA